MGPSGSGKSTLLHSLAAIISVDHDEIIFDGRNIAKFSDNKRSVLRRTAFGLCFSLASLYQN